MKETQYKVAIADLDRHQEILNAHRGKCCIEDCPFDSVVMVETRVSVFVRFCELHKKESKKMYDALYPHGVFLKIKHFEPQPLPADLKALSEKADIPIKLFRTDPEGIEIMKAILIDKINNKDKQVLSDGEHVLIVSEDYEN